IRKLKPQMFGLPKFAEELAAVLDAPEPRSHRTIPYRGGHLEFGKKTLIMGILNCTPDSFSDGGKWLEPEKAIEHALAMVENGADIIDVGGESTRPGSAEVSAEEEMARVIPVIRALADKVKVPISVDTYKAVTARAALEAGAHIINDVWGLQRDPHMSKVGAEYRCPIIIMHNKAEAKYDNFISEVLTFLDRSIDIGLEAGCSRQQFIVDPGFGFGKEKEHNLLITKNLRELSVLGAPILMAASRKKTVGLILDSPADQRIEGDAAVTAMSIANGADMVRVHDVKEMSRVAKMADAILTAAY
ncbi:MAG: dihydropteroate synthase, partial [Bacillota bacterium]|nr:dihydropteroate synthase [Bacillota bacterium]